MPAATIFLGLDGEQPIFAADLSDWEPDELPATLGAFTDPSEQRHPALPDDHRFAELRGAMTQLSARDAELAATARALLGWHRTHGFCARCGAAQRDGAGGLAARSAQPAARTTFRAPTRW